MSKVYKYDKKFVFFKLPCTHSNNLQAKTPIKDPFQSFDLCK